MRQTAKYVQRKLQIAITLLRRSREFHCSLFQGKYWSEKLFLREESHGSRVGYPEVGCEGFYFWSTSLCSLDHCHHQRDWYAPYPFCIFYMGSRVYIQLGASSFGTTILLIKLFLSHPKQLVKNAIGVDRKKEGGGRQKSLTRFVSTFQFNSIILYSEFVHSCCSLYTVLYKR